MPGTEEEFIDKVTRKLNADDRMFEVRLDATMLLFLVAQLQLAFRHPQNQGVSRNSMEKLVRDLIEGCDPTHGDVYRLLMKGFESDPDNSFERWDDFIDA